MSINDIKRSRFNNLLMEKWGYKIKEKAGHPGKTCNEAHPGEDHPEGDVNEDYDDKWGKKKKKKRDLEEAADAVDFDTKNIENAADTSVDAAEAERDAEDAVAAAKSQVAAGGGGSMAVAETLLRKKIREVLRNSFNAKS